MALPILEPCIQRLSACGGLSMGKTPVPATEAVVGLSQRADARLHEGRCGIRSNIRNGYSAGGPLQHRKECTTLPAVLRGHVACNKVRGGEVKGPWARAHVPW
jgi:hypothetical protein